MIQSKFQSILPKNGRENDNGENAFEVLLYLYKQCNHHTKEAFSVYKLIHFGIMAYMYGKFYHLST